MTTRRRSGVRFEPHGIRIPRVSTQRGRPVEAAASRGATFGSFGPRCPNRAVTDAFHTAGLAQLVEQLPCKHQVVGSSPSAGTIDINDLAAIKSLSTKVLRQREGDRGVLSDSRESHMASTSRGPGWGSGTGHETTRTGGKRLHFALTAAQVKTMREPARYRDGAVSRSRERSRPGTDSTTPPSSSRPSCPAIKPSARPTERFTEVADAIAIAIVRDYRAAPALHLAFESQVLTAAGPSESRPATLDEIDVDAATWVISASRMKMARIHRARSADNGGIFRVAGAGRREPRRVELIQRATSRDPIPRPRLEHEPGAPPSPRACGLWS